VRCGARAEFAPEKTGLLTSETGYQDIAMNHPPSFLDRHAALVFSLRYFAAAMLAFSIALLLDMPVLLGDGVGLHHRNLFTATY
jgi:hypothetical protein